MTNRGMADVIEAFRAAIIVLAGLLIIGVLAGADPSTATSLFESGVKIVVYVFVLVVIAVIILELVSGGR